MPCGRRVSRASDQVARAVKKWSRPAVESLGETVHDLADRPVVELGKEVVLLPTVGRPGQL